MNTWDAYRDAEQKIASASEHLTTTTLTISEHIAAAQPINAQWLSDHLLQIRLQVAFLASAAAELERVEALEARRALDTLTPIEFTPSHP